MSGLILGLHTGHNSSACIGDGTDIAFAIQEERLTGEKNYWGFPTRSIAACLDAVGASPADVEVVAHGSNNVLASYHSRDDVLRSYTRQQTLEGKLRQRFLMPLRLMAGGPVNQDSLVEPLRAVGLGGAELTFHEHHPSHGATAYYGLRSGPDVPYLVLTCDGVGDQICATVAVMGDGHDREVARTQWANSLGALYSWTTFGYGFMPLEHEYKLMGMAPYASPEAAEQCARIFERYLGLDDSGLGFKRKIKPRMNDAWARIERDLHGLRFDHVFAGLQLFTEQLLAEWVGRAVEVTKVPRVLGAGGVFMNVKANKRIAELASVESFEAFPSCGDETLSIGAYYLEAAARGRGDAIAPLRHFYLGDTIDEGDAKAAAVASGYEFERPDDLAGAVADLLVAGEPVARAAGPMEFGARALGNRSILADPKNGDVVRVINQMVKMRDFWMPFAPMVLAERQDEYLQNPKGLRSPFMMMTFDSRENFADFVAAVHNADLTCRPQILEERQNPEMYAILKAFEARTGRGVVLNTSFNLHGFPIVRSANDAIDVLARSGLRHLQVGPYLVHKP